MELREEQSLTGGRIGDGNRGYVRAENKQLSKGEWEEWECMYSYDMWT